MAPIVAVCVKRTKDEKCGIGLRKSPGMPLLISKVNEDGLFGKSDLKVGMKVLKINGISVEGVDKALKILKESEGETKITADDSKIYDLDNASGALDFITCVKEECGRQWNFRVINENACYLDHKGNPDDCTACLCPGCVTQHNFKLSLTFQSGMYKVKYEDMNAGSFNRFQSNMADTNMATNQIARMENVILQHCGRIEDRLNLNRQNAMVNKKIQSAAAAAGVQPQVLATAAGVQTQVMEERNGIADEIVKLSKLHKDGLLTDDEFAQAKAKVLLSS